MGPSATTPKREWLSFPLGYSVVHLCSHSFPFDGFLVPFQKGRTFGFETTWKGTVDLACDSRKDDVRHAHARSSAQQSDRRRIQRIEEETCGETWWEGCRRHRLGHPGIWRELPVGAVRDAGGRTEGERSGNRRAQTIGGLGSRLESNAHFGRDHHQPIV